MKNVKVKLTFTVTKTLRVEDDVDPQWAAECEANDQEFNLDGQVSTEFQVLED